MGNSCSRNMPHIIHIIAGTAEPTNKWSNKLAKETHKLHSQRYLAKFRDASLFAENVKNCIENSAVHKLKECISMNKVATLRSDKKAGVKATRHKQSLCRWFQPVLQSTPRRLSAQWKPDRLWHDARLFEDEETQITATIKHPSKAYGISAATTDIQ